MTSLQDEVILVVHPYYPLLEGEVKEDNKDYFDRYISNLERVIRERDRDEGVVLFDIESHYQEMSHKLGIRHYVKTKRTTGTPLNTRDIDVFKNAKRIVIVGSKIEGCLLTAEGSIRNRHPNIDVLYILNACYDDMHKYRDITKGDTFRKWS